MQVSVDGLRRSLADAYSRSVAGYREAIENNGHDSSFYNLKEGLDDLRRMIVGLFCCYSDDPKDLFSNLSDEAEGLPFADPKDADR